MVNYYKAIDESKVVSFDVFDTLIHRVVLKPTHVFDLLSKFLVSSDSGLYFPGLAVNFAEIREEAERHARENHFEIHGTPEITLSDIYSTLQTKTELADDICSLILEKELALESVVVYPNPLMKSLYEYAHKREKMVVLCSDMYLPKEEIEALLKQSGFNPPFTLFVSSELKKSKHEGSLFEFLLSRFNIKPNEVVHFGDNKHADFLVPKSLGVRAFHFEQFGSNSDNPINFQSEFVENDKLINSLTQGAIRKSLLESPHINQDFWMRIGLQIFGPLFLGNFIWLLSQIKTNFLDKLLFFARDADFPFKLYQRYAKSMDINIPAEYVYLSRAAILIPSFTEFKIDRVWHLFSGRSTRKVKDHLKRFGINAALVRQEIQRAGFSSEDEIVLHSDHRMFNLLKYLYPAVLETAKKHREIVKHYIAQITEGSQQIGIVDIGWTGNMQGSFSRILQLFKNDFELFGFYYGTFEGVFPNYLPRNHYQCYLVNEAQPIAIRDLLTCGGVELLEFALMAPHGTTLGYEAIGGKIQPVLEDNRDDQAMQQLAIKVQEGAMRFIEAVMPVVLAVGSERLNSRTWAGPFLRLVNDPTLEEAEILGELTHSDSATDTSRRLPLAQKLPANIARQKGPQYWKAHKQAYWKKAFEVRNR